MARAVGIPMKDAQKPKDPVKTPREIERLRKFLFKNQEYRFTDREQSHLFNAIQLHVTHYSSGTEGDDNPALGLLEDALKMPFTVFGTSHKKSFLKWHAKLTGGTEGAAGAGTAAAGAGAGGSGSSRLQLIDVGP
eukprot:CAMPEP_0202919280 /NCGR_PEP_ID=MMETSP1392-20130828/75455_1 /ASSEMBLY_ACC=CAM_ASM_000868 /TAXON_ID=225041 /ORGANISM="Chlamydomonas chlamydogama, Strain SAG 11-48b" /LENGTH=134 /DNA_ID=CAMNT_0049612591 /DNA_START=20 /DNA_END=422 /DNA_ORIENTATION=+